MEVRMGVRVVVMVGSLTVASVLSNHALAQATQVVEDKDVGVRFTIPKDWEWRSRDHDVFVNCEPKLESRPGMPVCYFTVQKSKVAPGQAAITDADRVKWKAWSVADGMRVFVSARDLRVAGFPAHEVIVRQGKEAGAAAGPRVFVFIPGTGVIHAWLYAWKDTDQTAKYEPGFRAALDSLKPVK
jgi:hypothetical protein